jgi:hypothetical protein
MNPRRSEQFGGHSFTGAVAHRKKHPAKTAPHMLQA